MSKAVVDLKENEVLEIIPKNNYNIKDIIAGYGYILSQYVNYPTDSFVDFARNWVNNPYVCSSFKENVDFVIENDVIIYKYDPDEEPETIEIMVVMVFYNKEKGEITAYVNGSSFFIVDKNGNKFYFYAD